MTDQPNQEFRTHMRILALLCSVAPIGRGPAGAKRDSEPEHDGPRS